jgi:hypothetical protein
MSHDYRDDYRHRKVIITRGLGFLGSAFAHGRPTCGKLSFLPVIEHHFVSLTDLIGVSKAAGDNYHRNVPSPHPD